MKACFQLQTAISSTLKSNSFANTFCLHYTIIISIVRIGAAVDIFFLKWCLINVRLQLQLHTALVASMERLPVSQFIHLWHARVRNFTIIKKNKVLTLNMKFNVLQRRIYKLLYIAIIHYHLLIKNKAEKLKRYEKRHIMHYQSS